MVVSVAVDDATGKARDARKDFAFEEVEEIAGEGATLGIFDMREKFARPQRTREIPFQIAFGEGMGKIAERGIDFSEQTAETFQEFPGMRIDLGKDCAGQKREQPDEARDTIGEFELREEFAIASRTDAWKRKLGSALGKMGKSPALHVDESAFAGGMHDLQNKLAGIGSDEVEVVVVFPGEHLRGSVEAVEG